MTQQNLLELAKQGDPKAIEAFINRSLEPKGILVKVNLTGGCLLMIAESKEAPDQSFMVDFVHKGLTNLNVEAIKRVVIRGQVTGNATPVWREAFELNNGVQSKQVQPSQSVNSKVSSTTNLLTTQPTNQPGVLNEILNLIKQNRNSERAVLVAGTFLFLWVGVGFKNSGKDGVQIATSLPGINKEHSIQGKLVITEAKFYGEIGSYCSGEEGYDDIEQGENIVIKNSKGEIIANSSLGAGEYVNALDSFSKSTTENWNAGNLPQPLYCQFQFTVDNVTETDFYYIEIGRRKGPTFSLRQMKDKDWNMHLSLGD